MRTFLAILLASGAVLAPAPAFAQPANLDALQRQLAALQTEVARLTAQVAELQASEAPDAPVNAAAAAAQPAPTSAPQGSGPEIEWKGAPEVTGEGGWSFKPRGRVQIDTAAIEAPNGIPGDRLGLRTELRRVFLGVDGTLPGNFGYRVEADLASSSVELTDVYLTYDASNELTLTLGQQKPFWGLEEMTSDVFTSMMERAAFNSAFGFERRVGLSGSYAGKDVLVQLGVFSANAADLDDTNDSYSLDARVVFSPRIGEGQLHIGGSAHFRDLNDAATALRYRARPFVHTTDLRLIDTGAISATGQRNFGLELAYIQGPFHVTLEGHQATARRPGLPDPTFRGGYAELGMLLTPGDKTGYRKGAYDRIRPANPVTEGGIGAIQLNARFDMLDLNDGPVVGGTQKAAGLSLIWIPTDYVRFLVNYGHLWIEDAAVLAGTDSEYQIDTFGVRAQVDF